MLVIRVFRNRVGLCRSPPEPDRNRTGSTADRGGQRLFKHTEFHDGTDVAGGPVEIVAQGNIRMVGRGHFHQPACHIHRISNGSDVLMAVASETRRNDHAAMGTDLEADA